MSAEDMSLFIKLLPIETLNTIYMVFISTLIAVIIGLPLGILLVLTEKDGINENIILNKAVASIINVGRSFPFVILMIAILPITRMIVGTTLGTNAAIVPLAIAAAPFVARLIETSIKEIDKGVIEASIAMGSSTWQIIYKVLLPEALPSITAGITLTIVNLIGYSAMAGTMGGGGLGKVAIQYGYARYNKPLMIATVIILIIIVECVQLVGNGISKKLNKK